MNYRRRLLSSAAFVAVTALVLFLPHLISSPIILPLLSKQLNRTLPGQLELQSCSFRWSGRITSYNVCYTKLLRRGPVLLQGYDACRYQLRYLELLHVSRGLADGLPPLGLFHDLL